MIWLFLTLLGPALVWLMLFVQQTDSVLAEERARLKSRAGS